jgi:hypothetical protein
VSRRHISSLVSVATICSSSRSICRRYCNFLVQETNGKRGVVAAATSATATVVVVAILLAVSSLLMARERTQTHHTCSGRPNVRAKSARHKGYDERRNPFGPMPTSVTRRSEGPVWTSFRSRHWHWACCGDKALPVQRSQRLRSPPQGLWKFEHRRCLLHSTIPLFTVELFNNILYINTKCAERGPKYRERCLGLNLALPLQFE